MLIKYYLNLYKIISSTGYKKYFFYYSYTICVTLNSEGRSNYIESLYPTFIIERNEITYTLFIKKSHLFFFVYATKGYLKCLNV